MLAWRRQRPQRQERVVLDDDKQAKIRPIASFLRLLHDKGLLKYSKKNHTVPFATRLRIQKLVFFATRFFGLDIPHWYIEYTYGPHSMTLTVDYYRIEDINDYDPITEAEWPRMNDFLAFAKDRDQDWLMIASTLAFTQSEKGLNGDALIDYVEERKAWHGVRSIHEELEREGLLRDAGK